MRARVLRWLAGLVLLVVVAGAAALAAVQVRWTRHFDAPYPAIAATQDPAVIEQGRYIVYSAAACAYCHVPKERWTELDAGSELPLSGHHLFRLPFGEIYSANLTTDATTGIGRRRDAEVARTLRYGVRADGRAAFPLMEIRLSDEDLTAVVSFLRSRPAVQHAVPDHRLSLMGKALMAFAVEPQGPATAPLAFSPKGPTPERGRYLANDVSSCVACHTDRGADGALVGPPFAGGQRMDVAADATKVYVTPNLTPDPATSPIGGWSEEAFLARMHAGERLPGTPMPWGAYARMTDDDLRAIYRYLRTLPPTVHDTGARVQPKAAS